MSDSHSADSESGVIRVTLAPGLTLEDIDVLLKRHFADGYAAGRRDAQSEAREQAHEARRAGYSFGRIEAENWVWINVLRQVEMAEERLDKFRIEAPGMRLTKAQADELRAINAILNRGLLAWEKKKGGADA